MTSAFCFAFHFFGATFLCHRSLLELSLDGNPVAGENGVGSSYRRQILQHLPSLHHLDLKRVTGHDLPLKQAATTTTNSPNSRPGTGNSRGSNSSLVSSTEGDCRSSPAGRPALTSTTTNAANTNTNHDAVTSGITNNSEHSHGVGQSSEPSPRSGNASSAGSSSARSNRDKDAGRHGVSGRTGEWTAPRPPSGPPSGNVGNTSPFKERHQHMAATAQSWDQVSYSHRLSRKN